MLSLWWSALNWTDELIFFLGGGVCAPEGHWSIGWTIPCSMKVWLEKSHSFDLVGSQVGVFI